MNSAFNKTVKKYMIGQEISQNKNQIMLKPNLIVPALINLA